MGVRDGALMNRGKDNQTPRPWEERVQVSSGSSLELDFQMWHSDFLLDNVDRPCHMEENPWIWDRMPTGRECLSLASVQKFSREGLGLV